MASPKSAHALLGTNLASTAKQIRHVAPEVYESTVYLPLSGTVEPLIPNKQSKLPQGVHLYNYKGIRPQHTILSIEGIMGSNSLIAAHVDPLGPMLALSSRQAGNGRDGPHPLPP